MTGPWWPMAVYHLQKWICALCVHCATQTYLLLGIYLTLNVRLGGTHFSYVGRRATLPGITPRAVYPDAIIWVMKHPKNPVRYFARNLSIVIGLVLIWRGIWYVLDVVDYWLFGGYHVWTAVLGIIVGVIILYIPDHDLKEIEKL